MGRTKKQIVTAEIHRKAGPHKQKDNGPKICPDCRGSCVEVIVCDQGHYGTTITCIRCKGEGVVYE
jgi:DnaJ-class molecular chaperone